MRKEGLENSIFTRPTGGKMDIQILFKIPNEFVHMDSRI